MRRLAVGAALAATAVAAASGSSAGTAEVTMPGRLFSPHTLDILVGTTVTWRNADRSTHTVTQDDEVFDSGFLRPGEAFSATFSRPGTFAYHCSIHAFMRGVVRVFEVVLHGPPEPLAAGRRARLEGVAPAGVDEVLLERVAPGPALVVARAVPAADGSFSFAVRAPEPRAYRVEAGPAMSAPVRVRVAPRVHAETRPGAIVVRTRPPRPGSRVALQEWERERFAFVTVARGVLDGSSRARIEYRPRRRAHVRAVVFGRGGWSDGASRALVVRSP